MPLRPHLRRQMGIQCLQQLGDVVVGDGHPLGDTGGARGVDEVGDVIRGRRRQAVRLAVNAGIVDIDRPAFASVQPAASPPVVIAAIGAASSSMNPIRARRQRRVDRHIRRPGLQHRQNRHDRLSRTRKQQRHTLPRARTMTGQQVRQPISGLFNLAIGPRALPAKVIATASGVRATCAAHPAGIDTRGSRAGSTPPGCPTRPAGRAQRHRADRSTTTAGWDRRSSPPTPAGTARSAFRCWPRQTLGVEFDAKAQFVARHGLHVSG